MKIAKLGLVCLALSIPALAACSGNDASSIDDDTSDVSKSSQHRPGHQLHAFGGLARVNSEDRINTEIKSAQHSLHIESLELADTGLIADITAQKQAGRDVEVLLADPSWSKGSKNAATAKTLQKAGIEVKWIPKSTMLVHVKSILVDGTTAYMGSENLTSTSMEQNREIGLIVTDAAPLATMEATFEKDFASAVDFGSTTDAATVAPDTTTADDDGTN